MSALSSIRACRLERTTKNCRLPIAVIALVAGLAVAPAAFSQTVNVGGVPDWHQPNLIGAPDGPGGGGSGPYRAWCTPTAASDLVGYWQDVRGFPIADSSAYANGVRIAWTPPAPTDWQDHGADASSVPAASGLPRLSGRDLGWFLNTNDQGDQSVPVAGGGATFVGTSRANMVAGLGNYLACRGYPNANVQHIDRATARAFDAWNLIASEVNEGRPVIGHFDHFNVVHVGGQEYNWGSATNGDPNTGEDWETYPGIGHATMIVGVVPPGPLDTRFRIIVQDNLQYTGETTNEFRQMILPLVDMAGQALAPWAAVTTVDFPVIYADGSAAPGGDGRTWATAYDSLQDALADQRATSGDGVEIWVAQGVYTPDAPGGSRNATFTMLDNVGIYGGFDGTETRRDLRDPDTNRTVLSGDLNGDDASGNRLDNSYHVVWASGVGRSSRLDGVVVRSGYDQSGSGGGIHVSNASPTIAGCEFRSNEANKGGAAASLSSSPAFIDCAFIDNDAPAYNSAGIGGAIYAVDGSPELIGCRFLGNTAQYGGGVWAANTSTSLSLVNCAFSGNEAQDQGGALNSNGAALTLANCTLAANRAGSVAGGIYVASPGRVTIANSVLWGNSDSNGMIVTSQLLTTPWYNLPNVRYSCVQGWSPASGGTAVVASDPMLTDVNGPDGVAGTADDDLTLGAGSPSIDAAENPSVPGDWFDLDRDCDVLEPTPYDAARAARFVDDPATPDTGAGFAPIVDMGAFEYVLQPCFADCDTSTGARVLDIFDFLCFQNAFVSGNPYACDCNTSTGVGVCDIFDFLCFQNAFVAGCP